MKVGGYRYALQKNTGRSWQTIASSDDRPLLEKMLGDQDKHTSRLAAWRLLDRTTDTVLREVKAG